MHSVRSATNKSGSICILLAIPQDTDSCITIQGLLCLNQEMSNLWGHEQLQKGLKR